MRFVDRGPRRRRWPFVVAGSGVVLVVFLVVAAIISQDEQGGEPPPLPTVTPDQGQANVTGQESLPPMVLAYFYYWYDLPDGPHSAELTDRPAEPDASYENVDWFEKQLADMEDAGIDVALAVYWGPEEPSSDIGLANMAQAADALLEAGRDPPLIGMFLDTGLIGRWSKGQRDLTKQDNQQRVYELIRTFYTILPRHQWALIDNRPVVWLWAAYFDITFEQSFFDYVSSRFTLDFGVEPYIVGENSWRFAIEPGFLGFGTRVETDKPIRLDDFYVWAASLEGFSDPVGGIAQVGPGFDERELTGPGRSGRFAEREGGDFYRRNLEAAIASGRRLLAIETWNEFHEANDIADSVEYGRRYIDITREYVDRFKAQAAAARN